MDDNVLIRQATRLVRMQQVVDMTGIPAPSLYVMMAAGAFPKQIALSVNRVAWIESEIQDWIRERIEKSRAPSSDEPQTLKRGRRPPKAARDDARPARVPRRTNSTSADGRRKAR